MLLAGVFATGFAQDFDSEQYKKASWMTTRFYGGQRSGENNWLVYGHQPEGVPANLAGKSFMQDGDQGHDLTGGWFDCGDHVKFGQTQYYSGYMLLKAYAEFTEGFDDYYSFDYNGYGSTGDWTFEGGKGEPNGIPDILDEVKHATDFFIKCAKDPNTFYYEVGHGDYDHKRWETAVKMQTNDVMNGGDPRPTFKNPNGAAMASMCSATLALMSRMYREYDAAYADLCLQHAEYAYQYASGKSGSVGAASGGFYSANDNWRNPWAICLGEMYMATNNETYLDAALNLSVSDSYTGDVHPNGGYTYDYSNNGEMALYVLGQIGYTQAEEAFKSRVESHFLSNGSYNGIGVYNSGGNWGKLRYVGNAAYIIALYNDLTETPLDSRVYDQVDYIMGSNSSNFSFLVGYVPPLSGASSAAKPHHRNVYLRDDNPGNSDNSLVIPTKNQQFGALVGGALTPGTYQDVRNDYVNTEVCIDYNAGITGALGAIVAEVAPVDLGKFTAGVTPDLGEDMSICGTDELILNSNVPTDGVKTFTWFRNDTEVQGSSTSANTFIISANNQAAGEYKVVVDSLDEWSTSDKVIVSDNLPVVDLGDDITLCSPSTATLSAGISGNGLDVVWTKDGEVFAENESSIKVTSEGVYALNISAAGCGSSGDEIIVESLLPETSNGYLCNGDEAVLSIAAEHDDFTWYDSVVAGNIVGQGRTIRVQQARTYYAEDNSSFLAELGPVSASGTGMDWGEKSYEDNFYLEFSSNVNFTIQSLSIPYSTIYNSHSGVVEVEIRNTNGDILGSFVSEPKSLTSSDDGLIEFTFTDFLVEVNSWGENLRMALNTDGTTVEGQLSWYQNGTYNYPYSDETNAISITGSSTGGQTGSNYTYFYDWNIVAGSSCGRAAAQALQSCVTNSVEEEIEDVLVYPNPTSDYYNVTLPVGEYNVSLHSVNGVKLEEKVVNGTFTIGENLQAGVYVLKINTNTAVKVVSLIKR